MRKIIVILFLLNPLFVLAQVQCPLGLVNDPYPGDCTLFVDTNGNTVCDLSEVPVENREGQVHECQENYVVLGEGFSTHLITGQELKTKTIKEVADIFNLDTAKFAVAISGFLSAPVLDTQYFQELHDMFHLKPSQVKEIAEQVYNSDGIKQNVAVQSLPILSSAKLPVATRLPRYAFFSLIIILALLFLLTYILSKYKKISILLHKRIWNLLLLLSFLAVGISGLLLVLQINYGLIFRFPFNLLYWHVEIGIVMALISFFHIAWHWKYFTSIIKRKK